MVLFFGIPTASFDLASFSFQVPICASLAKHTAPARKHSARANTLVLAFMSPPMQTTLGVVYGATSSAGTRILQIATLSNVYSAARLAAPVGTITDVSADPRQMGNLGLRRFRCRSGHP